jgi:hypothetical protein
MRIRTRKVWNGGIEAAAQVGRSDSHCNDRHAIHHRGPYIEYRRLKGMIVTLTTRFEYHIPIIICKSMNNSTYKKSYNKRIVSQLWNES